jgi:hypothetical protein
LILGTGIIGPATSSFADQGPDFPVTGGHFYTQANGQGGAGGTGFAVLDDTSIKFWSGFQGLGGIPALGYPISGRFQWDGFTVQAFQKGVLQWRPEMNQAVLVNLYDRMHDLGHDPWLQAFRSIPPIADWTSDTGLPFNQVAAKHLTLLEANPALKARYYAVLGDPVTLNGLPMAPIVPDNTASPNYYVIRCQRVTLQQWVKDAPASGAHAGDVVVTNAGDEAKIVDSNGIFPDNATLGPALPGQPNGTLVPGAPSPAPSSGGPTATTGLRYAFAVHMYNGQEAPVVNLTVGAGFGWIKQQVEWRTIQSGPGQYDYGELDNIVNSAAASHLNVLLSIAKAPTWASLTLPGANGNPPVTVPYPAHPSDLAAFMTNMATRYKGKVQAYEVWNEENFAVEVGPNNINAGNYVQLLHAAHDALKAVDPSIIVVSGAPTPTGVNNPTIAIDDAAYIGQMYAYNGGEVKNYFDVLGTHAEAWANPPEENFANHTPGRPFSNHPSFYFRRLEDYRAIMVTANDSGKQMFETEFGYDSCPYPNPVPPGYDYCALISEQQQADYLVRAFNYAKANYPWLGLIAVWNLNFQAVVGNKDEKWGWGLVRGDFSPRPSYTALKNMPKS